MQAGVKNESIRPHKYVLAPGPGLASSATLRVYEHGDYSLGQEAWGVVW